MATATDGIVESIIPYDQLTHSNKDFSADEVSFARLLKADPAAAHVDEFDHNGVTEVYNGILTVQAKTRLAMDKASGIMFWRLDHDARGELPLPNAIHRTSQQHRSTLHQKDSLT